MGFFLFENDDDVIPIFFVKKISKDFVFTRFARMDCEIELYDVNEMDLIPPKSQF